MLSNVLGTQKTETNKHKNLTSIYLCGPWLFWLFWLMAATVKNAEVQGDILIQLLYQSSAWKPKDGALQQVT